MEQTEQAKGLVMTATGLRGWVLVVAALALASCGDDNGPDGGLANPASVFCEEQGGTVEIVTDADGNQGGICQLPDGTRIEEWEYFRQFSGEGGGAGLANPAAVFCEEQGGIVSGVEPMCELSDGTVVDAWEYFREQSDVGQ
jgi:putative hemolysin